MSDSPHRKFGPNEWIRDALQQAPAAPDPASTDALADRVLARLRSESGNPFSAAVPPAPAVVTAFAHTGVTRFSHTAFAARPTTRDELRAHLRSGLPALLTNVGASHDHVDALVAFVTDEPNGRVPLADGRRFSDAFPSWVSEYAATRGLGWRAVTAEDMAAMAEAVAVKKAVEQFVRQVEQEGETAWPWAKVAREALTAKWRVSVAAVRATAVEPDRARDLIEDVAHEAERLRAGEYAYLELTPA